MFFQLPHQTSSQERKFPPDLKRGVKKREEHEDLPTFLVEVSILDSLAFIFHPHTTLGKSDTSDWDVRKDDDRSESHE